MRGEGAGGSGGILGSIVGCGGGNGGWIAATTVGALAAMRVGVLGGGGGGGGGSAVGRSGGGAGGCGGDVLALAAPCSGLDLSSSTPCANWHFLLYGHFPRLAKFWQTCVLYRTGSLMYAPGLRLIVCRAAAASGPPGVVIVVVQESGDHFAGHSVSTKRRPLFARGKHGTGIRRALFTLTARQGENTEHTRLINFGPRPANQRHSLILTSQVRRGLSASASAFHLIASQGRRTSGSVRWIATPLEALGLGARRALAARQPPYARLLEACWAG